MLSCCNNNNLSEQVQFTSEVQQWHRELAPDIPIGDFVNYLDPEILGLESAAQFYAPVEFSVHVKGHISEPAGAIRLHVPVHANENWLDILKEHIGSMYNVGSQYIDLKDVARRSISDFDKKNLPTIGKLSVFVDGRKARLDHMPEVPPEYSINKINAISSWYDAVKSDLPELVAKELVKCESVDDLIDAIAPGGYVETSIKDEIFSRTNNWNEFVRVNRMNSPYALSNNGAEDVLNAISGAVRSELNSFIQAAPEQITSYFSSIQAERTQRKLHMKGRETSDYKPLFDSMPAHIKVSSENGFEMFHDIASGVFDSPVIADNVMNIIYIKPIQGCRWETDPDTSMYGFDDERTRNGQGGGGGRNTMMSTKKSKERYSRKIVQPQTKSGLLLYNGMSSSFVNLNDKDAKQRVRNVINSIANTLPTNRTAENFYNLYVSQMQVSLGDKKTFLPTKSDLSNQRIGAGFFANLFGKTRLSLEQNYKELLVVGKYYQLNLDIGNNARSEEQMRYLISMLAERLEDLSKNQKFLSVYFGSKPTLPKSVKKVKPSDASAAVFDTTKDVRIYTTNDTLYDALKEQEESWVPYRNAAIYFEENFRDIIVKKRDAKEDKGAYDGLISNSLKKYSTKAYFSSYWADEDAFLAIMALIIFGANLEQKQYSGKELKNILYTLMAKEHEKSRNDRKYVFRAAFRIFDDMEKKKNGGSSTPVVSTTRRKRRSSLNQNTKVPDLNGLSNLSDTDEDDTEYKPGDQLYSDSKKDESNSDDDIENQSSSESEEDESNSDDEGDDNNRQDSESSYSDDEEGNMQEAKKDSSDPKSNINNGSIDQALDNITGKTQLKALVNERYKEFTVDNIRRYFQLIPGSINPKKANYYAAPNIEVANDFAKKSGVKTVDQNGNNLSKKNIMKALAKTYGINEGLIKMPLHHPWNAHIHKLKEVSGSYPEHYIENHNKMDLTENASYAADVEETYDAYHMFAGAAAMPDSLLINCSRSMKDKKKKKKNYSRAPIKERPPLISLQVRERPPLINMEVAMKMRQRNVPVQKIDAPSHGFAGLPSVEDL